MTRAMLRVAKNNPCPVCGHDSWCLIGERYVLCMRIQGGRQLQLSSGEFGWLHATEDRPKAVRAVRTEKPPPAELNVGRWLTEVSARFRHHSLKTLATSLGVSMHSLELLGCKLAWMPDIYAFPMRDGKNGLTGIRLRDSNGKKWAITGSHQGLFIPQEPPTRTILIVEGPTDCAAALTLGHFAIGRPSCSGGVFHIQEYLKKHRIQRAVIVADLDDPGMRGAATLAEHLPIWTATLLCPAKDLRSFLNKGGDYATLASSIKQLVWREPNS